MKKEYLWKSEDFLGCLLVLPYLMDQIEGELQQPNSGRTEPIQQLSSDSVKSLNHSSKQETLTS